MTDQITLLPLHQDLIPAAVNLDQRTLGGLWNHQSYQAEIERDNSICLGLITPSSDLIGMGITWVIVDEAHITLVAVASEWQSHGLGSILLNRLLQIAFIQKGCVHATLEVSSSNQSAIRLYEAFQFQTLGVRPNYYGKNDDALILWQKNLKSESYRFFLDQKFIQNLARLTNQGIQFMEPAIAKMIQR